MTATRALMAASMFLSGCGLIIDTSRQPSDASIDTFATDVFAPDAARDEDAPVEFDAYLNMIDSDAPSNDAGRDAGSDVGMDTLVLDAGTDASEGALDADIDAAVDPCASRLCVGDSTFQFSVASALDIDVSEDGEFVMVLAETGIPATPVRVVVYSRAMDWMPLWEFTRARTCSVAAMSDDGGEVLANCADGLRYLRHAAGTVSDVRLLTTVARRAVAGGGSEFAVASAAGVVSVYEAGALVAPFRVSCAPTAAATWTPRLLTLGASLSARSERTEVDCVGTNTSFPTVAEGGGGAGTLRIAAATPGRTYSPVAADALVGADVSYLAGQLATTSSHGVYLSESPPMGTAASLSVSLGDFEAARPMVGWVQDEAGTREAFIRPWAWVTGSMSETALRIHPATAGGTHVDLQKVRISDCGMTDTYALTAVLRSTTEAFVYRVRCPGTP